MSVQIYQVPCVFLDVVDSFICLSLVYGFFQNLWARDFGQGDLGQGDLAPTECSFWRMLDLSYGFFDDAQVIFAQDFVDVFF